MTKYVVSGYIGFDNFGDEAIAKVLVDRLKHEGAEKITLISSNPEKTAKLYGVEACPPFIKSSSITLSDVLVRCLSFLTALRIRMFLCQAVEVFCRM